MNNKAGSLSKGTAIKLYRVCRRVVVVSLLLVRNHIKLFFGCFEWYGMSEIRLKIELCVCT